jgi:hypothetical protein
MTPLRCEASVAIELLPDSASPFFVQNGSALGGLASGNPNLDPISRGHSDSGDQNWLNHLREPQRSEANEARIQ